MSAEQVEAMLQRMAMNGGSDYEGFGGAVIGGARRGRPRKGAAMVAGAVIGGAKYHPRVAPGAPALPKVAPHKGMTQQGRIDRQVQAAGSPWINFLKRVSAESKGQAPYSAILQGMADPAYKAQIQALYHASPEFQNHVPRAKPRPAPKTARRVAKA